MKRSLQLAAGITACSVLAGLPAPAQAQEGARGGGESLAPDSILAGATAVLTVEGMACPICARALETRLSALEQVDTAVVRLEGGDVYVRETTNQRLDAEAARRTIEHAGFVLKRFDRVTGER